MTGNTDLRIIIGQPERKAFEDLFTILTSYDHSINDRDLINVTRAIIDGDENVTVGSGDEGLKNVHLIYLGG